MSEYLSEDFEYVCQKRMSSGGKSKCRLPKNYAKNSFIQKSVVEDRRDREEPMEELPLPKDRSGMDSVSVFYSMNKRNRWKLAEDFREDITEFQDPLKKVRVSALEREYLGTVETRGVRNRSTGYHTVEGTEEIHRAPRGTYAVDRTLTEKPKPPKKKKRRIPNPPQAGRNGNRGHAQELMAEETVRRADNGPDVHIRYEVSTPVSAPAVVQHFSSDSVRCNKIGSAYAYYRCRLRRLDEKFIQREACIDEEPGSDYYSAEDASENSEEQFHATPSTSLLSDFFSLDLNDTKKKNKRNSKKKSSIVSTSSESSTDSGFEIVEKSWLRQVSRDDSYIPHKYRLPVPQQEDTNQPGTSGSDSISDDNSVLQNQQRYFKILPTSVEIPEEYLFPESLREKFGEKYYETACIPRRFCVDISESVRNVMAVSHGEKAERCSVHVLVVFQIPLPTLSHFKIMDSSVSPWEDVQVWVNGLFTRDVRHISLEGATDDGYMQTPEDVLKAAALRIGTLPVDYFEESSIPMSLSKGKQNSLAEGVMQDYLHPKSECLLQEEAAHRALQHTRMARKLQRQLTEVEQYAWFCSEDTHCGICYDYPVREIGLCLAECRHWFCSECWTQYCTEQIRNGRVPIQCPDMDCEAVMDYDTLSSLLPLPLCRNYAFLLRDQHLQENSSTWIWCPNTRCGRVVKIEEDDEADVLTCVCGQLWCVRCSKSVHWPVSCEHSELYLKKVKSNGHDKRMSDITKDHKLSVKQCPLCYTKMVKGPGCNYMACRCGGAFCWNCLQDFKKHDNSICTKAGLSKGWKMKYSDDVVDFKRCPHCRLPMQKGFGCNHIVCRCGREFCWSCLCVWDGGRHYQCKPEHNHETVALRDVAKGTDNLMKRDFYLRSVGHRQAGFPERVHALKKAINACLGNHNKLRLLPGAEERLGSVSPGDTQNLLKVQIEMASEFVRSFLKLHHQVHYFLEHTYVWLYFSRSKGSDEHNGLMRAADRLNFVNYMSEEACRSGNLQKVVELMPLADELLKKIVLQILMVKKQKKTNSGID